MGELRAVGEEKVDGLDLALPGLAAARDVGPGKGLAEPVLEKGGEGRPGREQQRVQPGFAVFLLAPLALALVFRLAAAQARRLRPAAADLHLQLGQRRGPVHEDAEVPGPAVGPPHQPQLVEHVPQIVHGGAQQLVRGGRLARLDVENVGEIDGDAADGEPAPDGALQPLVAQVPVELFDAHGGGRRRGRCV